VTGSVLVPIGPGCCQRWRRCKVVKVTRFPGPRSYRGWRRWPMIGPAGGCLCGRARTEMLKEYKESDSDAPIGDREASGILSLK